MSVAGNMLTDAANTDLDNHQGHGWFIAAIISHNHNYVKFYI